MLKVWVAMQTRFSREDGATLVEYALLLVLIAIVAIAALSTLGNEVSGSLDEVSDCLADGVECAPDTTVAP